MCSPLDYAMIVLIGTLAGAMIGITFFVFILIRNLMEDE